MAVISSEEVRNFAQQLQQMVQSVQQNVEGVQSSVHQAGQIWNDSQYEEFSAQLDALCGSLTSFYDEARVYTTNLEKKAAATDVAGGHSLG